MTQQKIQDLLKKINYIEAEVEIQKQILFSLPSDHKDEIKEVLEKIAEAKKQINQLREEIENISPGEFQKIINIENGLAQFREIAATKKFIAIENITVESACWIKCKDGKEYSCLIKASAENGDITVLTVDGEVLEFTHDEIVS